MRVALPGGYEREAGALFGVGTWADVPRWGDRRYPEEDDMTEQTEGSRRDGTHTPGPWEAQNTAGHDTHGQTAVYDGATGKDVAVVYDGEANARLIAASPDLLDALREIIKNAGYESGEAVVSEFLIQRRYLDTARAAIAAAEGS